MNIPRRTLRREAAVTGPGLFVPAPTTLRFLPGEHGLRVVVPGAEPQPLGAALLSQTPIHPAFANTPARSTNLELPGEQDARLIATVEHAFSALVGLGVTDADLHFEGANDSTAIIETPIEDGSAQPFTDAMLDAGLLDRADLEALEPITLTESIRVEAPGGAAITASPRSEPGCLYRYELDYGTADAGKAPIDPHFAEITLDHTAGQDSAVAYAERVAPARTFSLLAAAQHMQTLGLFAHLSPADMLVIGPEGPIDNRYRFEDEPARHKLLDLIGDLALAGRALQMNIVAVRSGHALNHQMAALLANAAIDFDEKRSL